MFLTTRTTTFVILGACAVLGGGVLLHSSPWGLGLSPDSVVYIGAARSLLSGHGFGLPGESADPPGRAQPESAAASASAERASRAASPLCSERPEPE